MTEPLNDTPTAAHVPDGGHLMPSGNWVKLRDPKSLTRGDRKKLVRQGNDPELDGIDTGFAVFDLLAKQLVTAWSYPFPLPAQDLSGMDQLPVQDERELDNLFKPAVALLFPKPVTPDDHADPASPSEPSSD